MGLLWDNYLGVTYRGESTSFHIFTDYYTLEFFALTVTVVNAYLKLRPTHYR